jgi:hypothetical protein
MLPVAENERRFISFKAFDKFYVARVLMFGAKSSPTLWGRCAAFLARSGQSLFDPSELLLQLFVDDTLAQAAGNKDRTRLLFTCLLLWWTVLGAKVAWQKGAIGKQVDWIGASLQHTEKAIIVSIKQEILISFSDLIKNFLGSNVVRTKALRSLCGKGAFIAGLVTVIRPFVAELWAALADASARDQALDSSSRAVRRSRPSGTVWRKQIQHALVWLSAFIAQAEQRLIRSFPVCEASRTRLAFWTDASPWGVGAILVTSCAGAFQVLEWLATPLFDFELELFGLTRGEPNGQAFYEALAVVVAARAWNHLFVQGAYASFAVRSDSLAALNSARKLSSSDPRLNATMQELALVVATSGVQLDLLEHTPGISNKLPDSLSRKSQPGPTWRLPKQLRGVPERRLAPRALSWYRAKGLRPRF